MEVYDSDYDTYYNFESTLMYYGIYDLYIRFTDSKLAEKFDEFYPYETVPESIISAFNSG